ncbi:hypothetical protein [Bacillus xiapuensis]|uniref:hypothetical protein n=1 Tax=Bacillus xiapuensis TaxID=2014075 RepID=UPI000C24FB85|nr:hypothetical protein [Bacillus xiapuensis]
MEKENANEKEQSPIYDLNIVYDYNEFPDKHPGRCDNCGNTLFKSSVHNYVFLRECRKCGMKKKI